LSKLGGTGGLWRLCLKEWKHEHQSMVVGDVVFVLYEETVNVDMKKTDKYVPRALVEIKQGEQRNAAICPVEEQVIRDNRIQEVEGDEVINSETDVAEEEKKDTLS
jgi:hypothetical protein